MRVSAVLNAERAGSTIGKRSLIRSASPASPVQPRMITSAPSSIVASLASRTIFLIVRSGLAFNCRTGMSIPLIEAKRADSPIDRTCLGGDRLAYFTGPTSMMENLWPTVKAMRMADSPAPTTGMATASLAACKPGSKKQLMTAALKP